MQAAYPALPEDPDEDSPAKRGTMIHALAAEILAGRAGDPAADEEAIDLAKGYVAAVDLLAAEMFDPQIHVERTIPFVAALGISGDEDRGCTPDLVIVDPLERVLDIVDLKTGRVDVRPENNPQLILYAISAVAAYLRGKVPQKVRLRVYQHGSLYTWETSYETLMRHRAVLAETYTLAMYLYNQVLFYRPVGFYGDTLIGAGIQKEITAALTPGPAQCEYCTAKAHCPALANYVAVRTQEAARRMPVPEVSLGEMAALMIDKKMVESFYRAVEARVRSALLDGEKVPGLKLVNGPRRRFYVRPENVQSLLQKEGVSPWAPRVLKSPAEVERELGKSRFTELLGGEVGRARPNPIVALEDDRRASYELATEGF